MKSSEEKINKFRETMSVSLTEVANTKGGLNILRYMYIESGFAGRSVVLSKSGKLDMEATFFNTARCDVYKDIRQFMTPEVIALVEHGPANEMNKKEEGGI